jgi:hypothetical protein
MAAKSISIIRINIKKGIATAKEIRKTDLIIRIFRGFKVRVRFSDKS